MLWQLGWHSSKQWQIRRVYHPVYSILKNLKKIEIEFFAVVSCINSGLGMLDLFRLTRKRSQQRSMNLKLSKWDLAHSALAWGKHVAHRSIYDHVKGRRKVKLHSLHHFKHAPPLSCKSSGNLKPFGIHAAIVESRRNRKASGPPEPSQTSRLCFQLSIRNTQPPHSPSEDFFWTSRGQGKGAAASFHGNGTPSPGVRRIACPAAFNQVYPRCYHFRPKPQLPPDEIPENGTVKFLEPPEDCTPWDVCQVLSFEATWPHSLNDCDDVQANPKSEDQAVLLSLKKINGNS